MSDENKSGSKVVSIDSSQGSIYWKIPPLGEKYQLMSFGRKKKVKRKKGGKYKRKRKKGERKRKKWERKLEKGKEKGK